jgi:(2Fe-2S) ferredoxin
MSEVTGFEIHLFVCTNKKEAKKNCFDSGGEDFRVKLKDRLCKLYGSRVRVNKAGCLGHCSKGPVVVVYPQAKWFAAVTEEDLISIEKFVAENIHES